MKKPKPLPVPTPDRAAVITAICSLQIERHNLLAQAWMENRLIGVMRYHKEIAHLHTKTTQIDIVIRFLETYL